MQEADGCVTCSRREVDARSLGRAMLEGTVRVEVSET